MNTTGIKELIEKYFDGETTKEEEFRLKEFFRHEKVPPDLAIYAGLFRYFSDSGKEEITDPEFERMLLSAINKTPVLPIPPERKKIYYIASMAAVIIILCGLIFTFRSELLKNEGKYKFKDTYSNPAVAYIEAQKAIMMVSANFNNGLDQIQKLQNFQKGVENLEKFSQFYKFQQIVINPDENKTRP